ncbi:MAG: hypothetical protein HYT98_04355 [Candidatus Sungbacteria bacterium]|nr:hypothetical protein [Candidatus Sungbacteria bacterium]
MLHSKIKPQDFRKLLRFVWRSPRSDFYRNLYKKAGFNPVLDFTSPADLTKVPFLTRSDLGSVKPKKRLYVPLKDVDYIKVSSGFSGEKKDLLVTYCCHYRSKPLNKDLAIDSIPPHLKKIFYLRRAEHVPIFFSRARDLGRLAIFGNRSDPEWSAKVLSEVEAQALLAVPTEAVLFANYIKKYYDPRKIKLVIVYGEPVTRMQHRELLRLYPEASVRSLYGMAVFNRPVGIQCDHLAKIAPNLYHSVPGYFYETKVVGKNGFLRKELVLTDFEKAATPFIRYRTGDAAKFINSNYKCRCGKIGLIFVFLGRVVMDAIQCTNQFMIRARDVQYTLSKNKIQYRGFRLEVDEKKYGHSPRSILKLMLFVKIYPSRVLQINIYKILKKSLYFNVRYKLSDGSPRLADLLRRREILNFQINFKKISDKENPQCELVDMRVYHALPRNFLSKLTK